MKRSTSLMLRPTLFSLVSRLVYGVHVARKCQSTTLKSPFFPIPPLPEMPLPCYTQGTGVLPAKTICMSALRQLYEKLNVLQSAVTQVAPSGI